MNNDLFDQLLSANAKYVHALFVRCESGIFLPFNFFRALAIFVYRYLEGP